jgi:hypothetical protein
MSTLPEQWAGMGTVRWIGRLAATRAGSTASVIDRDQAHAGPPRTRSEDSLTHALARVSVIVEVGDGPVDRVIEGSGILPTTGLRPMERLSAKRGAWKRRGRNRAHALDARPSIAIIRGRFRLTDGGVCA